MANIPNLIKSAGNQFVTTLAVGISDSATSMQLNSVTGLNTKGVLIIDEGNSNEEIVYFESVAGNIVTIATNGRGYAGTSAVAHSAGATVTDVLVDTHINNMVTQFLVEHNDDGTHSTVTLPAWTTYTPSLSGVTLGAGTMTASYQKIGKTVFYRIYLVFAADTSVSGTITIGLPTTIATYTGTGNVGAGRCRDTDASKNYDLIQYSNGAIHAKNSASTYLETVATSSSIPMTWAVNDYINITGFYETT